jgi:Arc/MetJ-type ribon-helix-helix transcriptional regulator
MTRTSVSFTGEEVSIIEDLTGDDGPFESRSEAVRECVQAYVRLHNEIEELHNKVDRLEREKQMILEHREEHTDLVESIQREESRQDRLAKASVFTRAKWWLTGMPNQ